MKTCFKCNQLKPLSGYYKHKMMGDGHLNKCIICTKKDTSERTKRKKLEPEWVIRERKRCRIKSKKRVEEGKNILYARKKPIRLKAHSLVKAAIMRGEIIKLPCQVCSKEKSQGHHEDYSKPIDVVWLCSRHHADRHIHLRDRKTLGIDPMPIKKFIQQLSKKLYNHDIRSTFFDKPPSLPPCGDEEKPPAVSGAAGK